MNRVARLFMGTMFAVVAGVNAETLGYQNDTPDARCDIGTMNLGTHNIQYGDAVSGQNDLFIDLNMDGIDDMVHIVSSDNEVHIRLGFGAEAFAESDVISLPSNECVGVRAADLNGDGILDLAFIFDYDFMVAIAIGTGEGQFEPVYEYEHDDRLNDIQLVDANGDQIPDLAILDREDVLSVIPGNGDGSFEMDAMAVTPVLDALTLHFAELTGDGILDVAMVEQEGTQLIVFRGDQTGTFQETATIRMPEDRHRMALGDLDNDGHVDIVVTHGNNEIVALYVNDSTGQFEKTQEIAVGGMSVASALVDLNADLRGDIVLVGRQSQVVRIAMNQRDGTFVLRPEIYGAGFAPWNVYPEDVNGDGAIDLRMTTAYPTERCTLYGNGDGTFEGTQMLPVAPRLIEFECADFDSDGRLDIAAVHGGEPHQPEILRILLQNVNGGFDVALDQTLPFNVDHIIQVGDLNGDEIVDLVLEYHGANVNIIVMFGQGDASFAKPEAYLLPSGFVSSAAIGDQNGDGWADLYIGTSNAVYPLFGSPSGELTHGEPIHIQENNSQIGFSDVDGDNIMDIFSVDLQTEKLAYRLGRPDAEFEDAVVWQPSETIDVAEFHDVNRDGVPDLIMFDNESNTLKLFHGDGFGAFDLAAEENYDLALLLPRSILVEDFNGDDQKDILAFRRGSGYAYTLNHVVADGELLPFRIRSVPAWGIDDLEVADMDGNGALDVITYGYASQHDLNSWHIGVSLNSCSGRPPCHADLNSDDRVDIQDLLIVLAAWETDGGDVNHDNNTDVNDLLFVINHWGHCP